MSILTWGFFPLGKKTKTNDRMSNYDEFNDSPPLCQCGELAVQKMTMKEGPNQGRPFFSCGKDKKDGGCGFFRSVDGKPWFADKRSGNATEGELLTKILESCSKAITLSNDLKGLVSRMETLEKSMEAALKVSSVSSSLSSKRSLDSSPPSHPSQPPPKRLRSTRSADERDGR